MKICAVNNKQAFNGKVYTAKHIPLSDLTKIEQHSTKLISFAKEKDFDYIIFRNGEQKGLSVLAKNLKRLTRAVFEVVGYPSGNESKDISLILKTMEEATDKLTYSKVEQGWSCE